MLGGEPRPSTDLPRHVGIIPDGNRRYARRHGLSKVEGYRLAACKALEAANWCLDAGIGHLSAFGVSQENIAHRTREEVRVLHEAVLYFCDEVREIPRVRLHVFGDAAALPDFVSGRMRLVELQETKDSSAAGLVVHVGVNYSGLAEMGAVLRAASQYGTEVVSRAAERFILSAGVPAIDLILRTGGEQRLSGFLPFQAAYAELWFTTALWPELTRDDFLVALDWYGRQARRFGE